ncbi:MAG: nucleoside hydrolase [Candidatus Dormibacteraceae bacterium]
MSTRLIIDTDTAQDDAFALLLALRTPGVRLEAITVAAGNVPFEQQLENALYTVEVAGRSGDVPVHPGARQPLLRPWVGAQEVHGADGMGDADFPRARQRPESEHAVDAMVRHVMASPGQIAIVAQAPLTNLALAVRREPRLPRATRHLYVMGGTNNGIGNITPAAEYNFYVDPEAAAIVLDAGFELTLVDWNLTLDQGLFDLAQLREIADLGTPLSEFFVRTNASALEFCRRQGIPGSTHPDSLTCAIAIDPSLVRRSRMVRVDVETQGALTRGYSSVDLLGVTGREPNARLVEEVDSKRFYAMMRQVLSGDRARPPALGAQDRPPATTFRPKRV